MCGIIGYIGNENKEEITINGLKELEYRGYDSAGIAILKDSVLEDIRAVGKISNLESKIKEILNKDINEGFGLVIGHTRWATHGKPSEINAHPHKSKDHAIIHNGIIENYKEIKKFLESKEYIFSSQTDSEVIVHLFDFNLKNNEKHDALSAFKSTIDSLHGAYAILLITKSCKNKIFYAKKSSPLIIGKGKRGLFFSSSDAPMVGLVDEVCYLLDGDYGSLGLDDFHTLKDIQPFKANKLDAQKNGFRFFMEKEIYEQEDVLKNTILGRVGTNYINLDELNEDFFNFNSISICACGTSYHSSLIAKYLIERKSKIKTTVHIASEFRYSDPVLFKDELFIVVSQSGETADTLEALKLAKSRGLTTLAICNVDNSSMVREAHFSILTRAGIEKGVASTKAFSTQVMVFWMLALRLGIQNKNITQEQLKEEISSIYGSIEAMKIDKAMHERIFRLSKRYLHGHGFFFIGRDIFYPLALEGALKLKEISYLHAEGYPSGEMKHGPIALADKELFTIALMPKNLLTEKIKSNVEELCARDSTVCVITSLDFSLSDDLIKIPCYKSYMEEFFSMTTILQLLSLEISIRLKNDVDMPRNLAKSVTVE